MSTPSPFSNLAGETGDAAAAYVRALLELLGNLLDEPVGEARNLRHAASALISVLQPST